VIRTRGSAVVGAAPADVYALLVDPLRMAALAPHPVEILAAAELGGGRRFCRIRTRLPNGATVEAENTLVEHVPHQRVVVVGAIRPFGFAPTSRGRFGRVVTRVERTLAEHPRGTAVAVTAEVRITPALLRAYFGLVKRDQWQRATDADLARLRAAFAG